MQYKEVIMFGKDGAPGFSMVASFAQQWLVSRVLQSVQLSPGWQPISCCPALLHFACFNSPVSIHWQVVILQHSQSKMSHSAE